MDVAWLVPHEMLPFRRKFCVHHSTMHQVTVSLHSKPSADCASLVSQFFMLPADFLILACSEYAMQRFKVEFILSVQQVVKWVLIGKTQGGGQRAHWIH